MTPQKILVTGASSGLGAVMPLSLTKRFA